jgi:hypothetical protein
VNEGSKSVPFHGYGALDDAAEYSVVKHVAGRSGIGLLVRHPVAV